MSEQFIRLQDSTDLTEDLFNELRERSLQIDETFGSTNPELFYPAEITDNQQVQHTYELAAHAGISSRGLGMQGVGLEFSLMHFSTRQLEPGTALQHLQEQVPDGEALIASLESTKQTDIRSADEALLSILWRYAVNSFSPDMTIQHGVRLAVVQGEEVSSPIVHMTTLQFSGIVRSSSRFRRARHEQAEIRRRHVAQHVEHILHQFTWSQQRAA